MVSLGFTGVTTNMANNKVVTREVFENLEILTSKGDFNFTGDPRRFSLFAEAERINSAYQFDPLFLLIAASLIHCLTKLKPFINFFCLCRKLVFLADDTGAGKTIMTGLLLKGIDNARHHRKNFDCYARRFNKAVARG